MAYFQTEDLAYLKEIENNLRLQNLLVTKSLVLEVPEEFSADWLNYLNSLNTIAEIMDSFIRADQDPVAALAALTIYKELMMELETQVQNILLYFN